ncbi:armadillo-type protein [Rhodocollybia butyracea]|uniref:Armadillo-type protein n=1 Tax=Rhodocollybia butyracea TaxID=206335 RepID=A0A9P5TXG0_9AGAR|nr:armadillo-type protein [Rhodocollybia butyracea]KAF9062818.1 armadillo-type protein [Rhodocollybia butyracea]
MAWNPQAAGLQEILTTIHKSMDVDVIIERNITQRLLTRAPDYIGYLAHILTAMPQEEEKTRTAAGFLLKNNAPLILSSSPEVAQYVKVAVFRPFDDDSESVTIRAVAGQCIVSFLGVLEPRNWPECLPQLLNMLDLPDLDRQEAVFNVLQKACEEYPRKLDVEIGGARPLDFMIPKFLLLGDHISSRMRSHAVACLACFVPVNSQSLYVHVDTFIACLLRRASDEDPSVRQHVCQALASLLATRPEKLVPKMEHVAEFMLDSMKEQNENIAFQAAGFWLTFAKDFKLAPSLQLNKVAPVLLDCVIYGQDLEGDAIDAAFTDDKETNVKPRHCGAKSHGFDRDAGDEAHAKVPKPCVEAYREKTIDSDDNGDFLDDDESENESLRTRAAAALDALAVRCSSDLLDVLLAPLKGKLWSNDWLQRESGILALGAIAEGCIEAIEPHLSTLVPHLINTLNDSKPLVRSTTCWTLGCYASWTTQPISDEHKEKYFIPTMKGLLCMILDNNEQVQEAGCSAFATLVEHAGMELAPYLELVLHKLVSAFEMYQHKDMLILFDAVGTLADAVGRELSDSTYVEILMPPLTNCWAELKDEDIGLIPLLECFASVTIAMGQAFLPYAPPVFERCCSIILQYQQFQQNPDLDEPDKSCLVATLNVLSGLTQGLGMALKALIGQSQPNLLTLLTICLKHPQVAVRQSAYALVGDMAMACFPILKPHMPGIMAKLILQLDPEPKAEFLGASDNAAWSVGEVALRYGDDPEFQQWVPSLISRLIPILLHPKAPRSLRENAAVSIGRIGLMHPNLVAPHLPEFAQAWCQALYEIRDNEEKDSAFRGLCTMVQVNQAGIANSLWWLCNSIVQWNQPSPKLNNMFKTLLQSLKQHDETGWAAQVAAFSPVVQEQLATRFGV